MRKSIFIIIILKILVVTELSGQGCSDAGFCSINNMKPHGADSTFERKNYFKTGISYGAADKNISAYSGLIEYGRNINKYLSSEIRLTALSHSGNNVHVTGLSDIYLNVNYRITDFNKIILGLKLPLGDGNKMKNNLPLPMDYQSTLGTVDLIAGYSHQINKIQLVAAYQQPLSQNKNQFISETYPEGSTLKMFQSTNKFIRSGDMLLRISYPVFQKQKFAFTGSLLPVYHLKNDRYTDLSGMEKEIKGSQGLTLNGNIFIDYKINTSGNIQLIVGAPFIVRETRPDGLTRSLVVNIEYGIKF